MTIAEMLRKNREEKGLTQEALAKKLSAPVAMIAFLEDPEAARESIVALLAAALDMTPQVFRGEAPPETEESKQEKRKAAAIENAKFPKIREFVLDPSRCETPAAAIDLFGDQELSLAERNVILYLSTRALYHFCDTNTSSFAFDEYLFTLHGALVAEVERSLTKSAVSAEQKEERLGSARSNVFACDTMENIAIRVLEAFASEMEQKLAGGVYDFDEDLGMPFVWGVDETLMKIHIKDEHGAVKDTIRLLDVKEKTQAAV